MYKVVKVYGKLSEQNTSTTRDLRTSRPCHHSNTIVEGAHCQHTAESSSCSWSSSTPQAFSLSSCTADDLHLLHPPHSRICLSHVEQLDEERGRPAGTIPATSCSPHPWHTAFQEGRPLTSADSSQPPDVRVSQSLRTRGLRTAVVYWSSPQPPQGREPAKTCGNV